MLFQPTNITPSSFAGVGGDLVDVDKGITVSWQVNGTSPMTAYRIVIYQNDAASTQVYTTGKVTLDEPFYGTDGMGNLTRFSVTIPYAEYAGDITNGYANGYKYKITQWWSANDYIEQSAENFFLAQTEPYITINTDNVTSPNQAITATVYSQPEGVGLDWVRWTITPFGRLVDGSATQDYFGDPVFDTGILHTQIMELQYDGWISGWSYNIKLYYQFQNGYQGEADGVAFVEFEDRAFNGAVSAALGPSCDSAYVTYPLPTFASMQNIASMTATIENGVLTIADDSSVAWDMTLYVDVSNGVFVWCGIPREAVTFTFTDGSNTNTVVLDPEGTVTLTNGGGNTETMTFDADVTGKQVTFIAGYGKWYLAANTENGVVVYEKDETGALNYLWWEDEAHSFSISGRQDCYYTGFLNGYSPDDANLESILQTLLTVSTAQPAFNQYWLFLTDFSEEDLEYYIGSVGALELPVGATVALDHVAVYRTGSGEYLAKKILEPASANEMGELIDYGVVNGKQYTYRVAYYFTVTTSGSGEDPLLVAAGDEGETFTVFASGTTEEITPCYWDWLLATAAKADDGTYRYTGQYRFGLNLESGAISNNNAPSLLQNFTRYPTRQGVSANYRSGSLTAYIGEVDHTENVYIDTAAQAEAIFALSTSADAKFLRNRKGELWMIDTAGATTMQLGDKYREQPYIATLNWVETGDASEAVIIITPADDAWNTVFDREEEDGGDSGGDDEGTVFSFNGTEVPRGSTITINMQSFPSGSTVTINGVPFEV